ncbi:MAG: hypothetical protein ABI772_02745 [Bacteroidota bacterium]
MPLTKTQKSELKKIDSVFKKMEKLSGRNGISLDQDLFIQEFQFNNLSDQNEQLVFEQGRKRREVFELSKQVRKSWKEISL